MAGRPKKLTEDQVKENRQTYQKKFKSENIAHLKQYTKKYQLENRLKLNTYQNSRNKSIAEKLLQIKNDPFYSPGNTVDECEKTQLRRMAELLKVGCSHKKIKGSNYKMLTCKDMHIKMMAKIGFVDVWDIWISRSFADMAMKINKWKDIYSRKIYYDKMVAYGYLKWKIGMITPIVDIILSYIEWKPITKKELFQITQLRSPNMSYIKKI